MIFIGVCLIIFMVFYVLHGDMVKQLFPNKILITTQGQFVENDLEIKLITETTPDTLVIYDQYEQRSAFQLNGYGKFLVYHQGKLMAEFEHVDLNTNIGNTYHFYLSAKEDSVYLDMRVEGAGSAK